MSYSRFPEETPLIPGMMHLLDHAELCKPARLAAWIQKRLDEGLNTFDHADIYGDAECERVFGEALSRLRVGQIHTFLIHRPDPLLDAESLATTLVRSAGGNAANCGALKGIANLT